MPQDIKDTDFQSKVIEQSKTKPVLVDFWAPWCGPCKILAPILEDVARDMGEDAEILKINVDENPITTGNFGIRSIPTMILFRNGDKVETIVGLSGREEISNLIKKHK